MSFCLLDFLISASSSLGFACSIHWQLANVSYVNPRIRPVFVHH